MTISRGLPRVAGAMAALFLTGALVQVAPAHADIVFDFSGTCTQHCTGMVSAVLTLADTYIFGADIAAADFISFDYSSSQFSFDITGANDSGLGGGLNADGSPSAAVLSIVSPAGVSSFADFQTIQGVQQIFVGAIIGESDEGLGTFTLVGGAVPEPSTWAMLLLGFAGFGYAGYRTARPVVSA